MTLYVKDRSVILRDPKTGKSRVFNKGDEIPSNMEDLIENGSVVEELSDEDVDNESKVKAAKSTADTTQGGAEEVVEESSDEEPEEAPETTGEETAEELDANFTVPQLRAIAEDEGADLEGASKKAEVIDRIIAKRDADNG